ncbi:PilT/PilU family type 4a pilus ATPase [Cardiobacteriaceae bacterium TAE3-ERU3]|nr:PilT/PilU family type 4a pilus ATPase [Cardiobacteriaceae bacterium TAE3-ERU3]
MAIDQEKLTPLFEQIVKLAKQHNASDIFINSDNHAAIKRDGELHYLKKVWLEIDDVFNLLKAIVRPEAYQEFIDTHEMNAMIEVSDMTILRVNAYMQRNKPGIVMRLVPSAIPSLESLNLPGSEHLEKLAMVRRGLVIVAGATGNGKSTTLAAMIDLRNQEAADHIITVEDPIEFMYTSKKSVVIQREVGIDTASYGAALKNSLRQAPNVVLIGEIRDTETMEYALHFAETGHLCLATLHATNAVQAIDRIINFFSRDQRIQLQKELAGQLRCIVVQRLIRKSDGSGRIAAMEMMMNTPFIQQLIHDGELSKIPDAMKRANPDDGVFTFDECIFNLYEQGLIDFEEAEANVNSSNDFRVRLRNQSTRQLPPELQAAGEFFKVRSDESVEHEMLKARLAEQRKKRS